MGVAQTERAVGFESCLMVTEEDERLEGVVTDDEVRLGYGNLVAASYDREGRLTSASFSLTNGVLMSAEVVGLPINDDLLTEVEKLKMRGVDFVLVVNFDDDGEGKTYLVKTERGGVVQLIDVTESEEMVDGYETGDEEDDEPGSDFVIEGEEELVGELLAATRMVCPFPVWGVEYGVGVRSEVLDFVVIEAETEEAMPFHVNLELDLSVLQQQRLDGRLLRRLARRAFPGADL